MNRVSRAALSGTTQEPKHHVRVAIRNRCPGPEMGSHLRSGLDTLAVPKDRALNYSYPELPSLKASYIPVHTCLKRRQVRPDKQPREARHRKLERPIVAAIECPSAGLRRPSRPIRRSKLSYREQQGLPLHALTTGHDIPPSNSVPTCPQQNSGSLVKSETHQINSMRATAGLS